MRTRSTHRVRSVPPSVRSQPPPRAFSQFIWIGQLGFASVMLYAEPLDAVLSGPNFHAHLSAFSAPLESYQALRSGSLIASSDSWAMIEAMPSAPLSPFGLLVCASQADGQRAGLPSEADLIGDSML